MAFMHVGRYPRSKQFRASVLPRWPRIEARKSGAQSMGRTVRLAGGCVLLCLLTSSPAFPGPLPCVPPLDGSDCVLTTCPEPNDTCRPTERVFNPATGQFVITKCDCVNDKECYAHVEFDVVPPVLTCPGDHCPGTAQRCQVDATPNGDGTTTYDCCPPPCPTAGPVAQDLCVPLQQSQCINAGAGEYCRPTHLIYTPETGQYSATECACVDSTDCYIDFHDDVVPPTPFCAGQHCAGTPQVCRLTYTPNPDGTVAIDCCPPPCPTAQPPAVDICGPLQQSRCANVGTGDSCRLTRLHYDPESAVQYTAIECDCVDSTGCYLEPPPPHHPGALPTCHGVACPDTRSPCDLAATFSPEGTIDYTCCTDLCPLPDSSPNDPCAFLQEGDCVGEANHPCVPTRIRIVAGSAGLYPVATDCTCMEAGCGRLTIIPLSPASYAVQCECGCPDHQHCELFVNDIPQSGASVFVPQLSIDDIVRCECVPSPSFCLTYLGATFNPDDKNYYDFSTQQPKAVIRSIGLTSPASCSSFQTRYAQVVATNTRLWGSESTIDTYGDYTLTFRVNASPCEEWCVGVVTCRRGKMVAVDDGEGCSFLRWRRRRHDVSLTPLGRRTRIGPGPGTD